MGMLRCRFFWQPPPPLDASLWLSASGTVLGVAVALVALDMVALVLVVAVDAVPVVIVTNVVAVVVVWSLD